MNIMLFTTGTVINTAGGAEKIFFEMANNFAKSHNVCAVAFDDTKGKPFWKINNNVKFYNIGLGNSYSNIYINFRTFYIIKKDKRHLKRFEIISKQIAKYLLPLINKEKPDIIICYDRLANFVIKEKISVDIPVITMFHSSPDAYLAGSGENLINKALEKCECIQVLMPDFINIYKKYVKTSLNQKIVYIPNPVKIFNLDNYKKEKVIVNIGRLSRDTKRQHLLILAFAAIQKEFPDWQIKIYGDYSIDKQYYAELQKIIIDNKLIDKVKFCGLTHDIEGALKEAAIFAFPSSHEGFGLAVAEAMGCGVPSLAYKSCTGVNQLIKDGENGYLVEDGVEPFAYALKELMQNKSKREKFGLNARKDIQIYNPDLIWDKWENLIKEICKNTKNDC